MYKQIGVFPSKVLPLVTAPLDFAPFDFVDEYDRKRLAVLRERDEMYKRQDRTIEIQNEQFVEKFGYMDQEILDSLQQREFTAEGFECARKLRDASNSPPRILHVDFSHSKINPIRYSMASYRGGDEFKYFIINGNENFIYSFRELKLLILINKRCIEPTTNLPIQTIERVELSIREPSMEDIQRRVSERTAGGLRRMSLG